MKLYRLPFVLHEPSEDSEGKYRAEIPALSGCRAWGSTAAEALENLQSVATAFIESYKSKGDPLPGEVKIASDETGGSVISKVLVAA